MKSYNQFCPVAKAAEVFAERWTPLILRELCHGPKRFNEFRVAMPLISRTILATRLRELAAAEVIEIEPKATGRGNLYRLTEAGEAFRPIIELLGGWGQQFGPGRVEPGELDAPILVWGMQRHIDPRELPPREFVVRFEFRGLPKRQRKLRYWWLVMRRDGIEVCLRDPNRDVDVVVAADLGAFTHVWMGYLGLDDALEAGSVAFTGAGQGVSLLRRLLRLPERRVVKLFALRDWSATA